MVSDSQSHTYQNEERNEVEGSSSRGAAPRETTPDALIACLPAAMRIAYVMRWRCGLSDGAIAAHLHVSPEEARRLCDRAQSTLRRLLLVK